MKDNVERQIVEREELVTLKVSSTRGTGTRDQDTVKGELRRETLEDIEADKEQFLELIEHTMSSRRAANEESS